MRDAVSSEERLSVTLRYLATGNSYQDLKFSTAISPQLLSRIVPEICAVIYEELAGKYMKVINSFITSLSQYIIKRYTIHFHGNTIYFSNSK
jgi:hypothetical protein